MRYGQWFLSIAAIVLMSSMATGKAVLPSATFDVIGDSAIFDGSIERKVASDQALVPIELTMPSAVMLDEDVPRDIQDQIGASSHMPLVKGAVLFSSIRNRNIFCLPVATHILAKAGPCLLDTKNTGLFDTGRKAGSMAGDPAGMGISNGLLLGVNFGTPVALPAPVRYHSVPGDQAPRSTAFLVLQSDFNRKKPGPVKMAFHFRTVNGWQGTMMATPYVFATYSGSPMHVAIGSLDITVLSIDDDGLLHYKIQGSLSKSPLSFGFYDRVINVTVIYI